MKGKVKWFDVCKGFGFIKSDDGNDIFFHHSAIRGMGYNTLNQGETVIFDVMEGLNGPHAVNIIREITSEKEE